MPGKDLVIAAVITVAIHFVVAFVHIPALFTLPEINKNKPLEISLVSSYKRVAEESRAGVLETKEEKNKACDRETPVLKKRAKKRAKREVDVPATERRESDIPRENLPVNTAIARPTLHAAHNKNRQTEKTVMAPAVPRYQINSSPEYPAIARRRGYEGSVLLSTKISIEGNVVEVRIKESSGHSVLDRAAVKAVEVWAFEPARRMGIPIPMLVDVPVRFVLRRP